MICLRNMTLPAVAVLGACLVSLAGCTLGASSEISRRLANERYHNDRIIFLNAPSKTAPDRGISRDSINLLMAENMGFPAVYLEKLHSLEILGSGADPLPVEVHRRKYLIRNPANKRYSTFSQRINAERYDLDSLYLIIWSPDGKSTMYGKDDLTVTKLDNDSLRYDFAYPDVQEGSVIEEGFIVKANKPTFLFEPDDYVPLQFSIPALKLDTRFVYPRQWDIRVKQVKPDTMYAHEVRYDTATNAKVISVSRSNVPGIADEVYSPSRLDLIDYFYWYAAEVTFRKNTSFIVTASNSGNAMSAPNWTRFTEYWAIPAVDYRDMREYGRKSTIQKLSAEIVDSTAPAMERIEKITAWCREKMKIAECRRCDWEDMIEKGNAGLGYINEITRALLFHAGLDSRAVFIHPKSKGYFDTTFISYSEIVGPGIAVLTDADTVIVFPTIEELAPGVLPADWEQAPAIYADYAKRTVVGMTPKGLSSESVREKSYDLSINASGAIQMKETRSYRGLEAYYMREELKNRSSSATLEIVENLLTYDEGEVSNLKYEISNQEDIREPLLIKIEYQIDNLVTVLPDEVLFQTGGLFSPTVDWKRKGETGDRQNPIRIYREQELLQNITIHYPQNWKLHDEFGDVKASNRFGEIEVKYSNIAGEFRVEQRRLVREAAEPKEAIGELLEIVGPESGLQVPTMTFEIR